MPQQTPIGWDANGRPLFGPTAPTSAPAPNRIPSGWDAQGKPIYDSTIPQRQPVGDQPAPGLGQQLLTTGLNTMRETAKATVAPVAHPLDFLSGIVQMPANIIKSHMDQGQKAWDAFQRGDRSEAVLREIAAIIPIIGPIAADYADADQAGKEQIAGGLGAGIVQGRALQPRRVPVSPAMRNPNAVTNAAVQFGQREGIPIDAATATGNRVVRGTQYLADRSLGGAIAGQGSEAAQQGALASTGRKLATASYPKAAVSPYQAGEAIIDGIKAKQAAYGAEANAAYDTLRAIEADPSMTQKVSMRIPTKASDGTTQMSMVTVDMQMPVSLRLARERLRPIYDRMRRQMPVAQQHADPALKAMQNIMDAPDYMPASVVDMDLSAIKAMARIETPGVSKALLNQSITALEYELQKAVSKGGQKALNALAEGRQATVSKASVTDLLKQLREEPRQVFDQAVWKNDSGIDRLKEIAQNAPDAMPKVGRAFLDDLIDTATTEGKFDKARSIATKWDQLGPKTKELLFPNAAHRADLQNFFNLAKTMAENPNPSGTGHLVSLGAQGALMITEPVTGATMAVSGAALSKLLHSPAGVRALTNGIRIPIGGKNAAALTAFATLSRLIGDDRE